MMQGLYFVYQSNGQHTDLVIEATNLKEAQVKLFQHLTDLGFSPRIGTATGHVFLPIQGEKSIIYCLKKAKVL